MHQDDGARSSIKMFANIFISFIGAGILGMPHAFKEAGVIEGSAIMALIGTLSVKAMLLIIDCKKKLTWKKMDHVNGAVISVDGKVASEEKELLKSAESGEVTDKVMEEGVDDHLSTAHEIDYGDLGFHALGNSGRVLVDTSIVISQIGFSCAYLIFISDTLNSMLPVLSKHQYLMTLLPPLAVLVNFRHLKKLAVFSLFADFANVFAYCVVFWFDFAQFEKVKIHPQIARISGLPFFLGVAIYCYEGAGLILSLEASCARDSRDKFRSVFKLTLFLVTTLYIAFGACGYLSFGELTQQMITLNLPFGPFPAVVQLCLCFSLFFTYPIMMFPVVLLLEKKLLPDGGKSSYYQGTILRACVVVLSGIVVLVIPNFSTLMAFFGSSCCTLLGFVLPGIFHLRIFEGHLTKGEWFIDILIIFLGLVGAVIGTRDALLRLLSGS
ncbi:amino acid transporter AVT3C-like isoform X1 [Stylophora pistillata]|uniref:Proton-coupled amino acid transporter 1 n=1 Tax=Stylophora pistillata TaxID=50429 RepID=A0A2B4RHS4_STYPI|nr:amino acid transporter AVT3C-like isoform X1 [Stylophora pistillata]PFX16353.1 Proton-coupled amino acid transporter 1 [Stylophora pistillata]